MTTKVRRDTTLAAARRNAKAAAHEALMAQHAAHREAQRIKAEREQAEQKAAIAAYNRYWSAWLRGGCKGPKPVKPKFM